MTQKGIRIQKKIMTVVNREQRPLSTREIALKLKVSWHTVQEHCLELFAQGKLERMRVGTTHVWMKKKQVDNKISTEILDAEILSLVESLVNQKMQEKEEKHCITSFYDKSFLNSKRNS